MPIPTYKNRVGVATSTTGTSTMTLGAVESGYQGFAAGDDGKYFDVVIEDGTAWEVCRECLYTHSGTTLTRGTLEASNTGARINLTGSASVYVTQTAERAARESLLINTLIPGGRLTLESGVSVSSSSQTAKTTVYYTPHAHNVIPLWDGGGWKPVEFAETSLALGALTNAMCYDIFGYLNGDVLALELLAWSSSSARATGISVQDGKYCKMGDHTRLYLGTFYTTSTTTTEDSATNRYLWNLYNRVARGQSKSAGSSSHSYTTFAWRSYNNDNSQRLNHVVGIAGAFTYSGVFGAAVMTTAGTMGMGLNTTTSPTIETYGVSLSAGETANIGGGKNAGSPALGLNYWQLLERGTTGSSFDWGSLGFSLEC